MQGLVYETIDDLFTYVETKLGFGCLVTMIVFLAG
jgi:hypothetical protein